MDTSAYNAGKAAYIKGDYATAQAMLQAAKDPGEINGALDHMLGNSLMKMGMYREAAQAYRDVLKDETYHKVGAINTNLGRALAMSGQDEEAIRALDAALQDIHYKSPYKAQMALGKLLQKRGDARAAGAAFRSAAIDERNPDPSVALMSLGSCFMELGRPMDAVEAFRTALDFSSPRTSQSSIYAALGEAFVASNRMQEALDAFKHALSTPGAELSGKQEAAYTAAKHAVAALMAKRGGTGSTDALLAAGGYQVSGPIDPLDPLQQSGELMPSPEDTGFFSVTEQDLMAEDQKRSKNEKKKKKKKLKKKRHVARTVIIILVILLVLAGVGAGWAYFQGYGYPDSVTVTQDLFLSKSNNTDPKQYLDGSLNSSQQAAIVATLPTSSDIDIKEVQRAKDETAISISVLNPGNVTTTYNVLLVRDGLGWKVKDVQTTGASLQSGSSTLNATPNGLSVTPNTSGSSDVSSSTDQADQTNQAAQ